jgi:hypothetical protein
MRVVWSLLLLAAASLVAAAQTGGGAPPAPAGLTLEKPEWGVIHATFYGTGGGGGPSGPAIHPRPMPGNQLSYSSSYRGGGVFGPSTGEDLWRRATVRMTNAGTRSVKLVRMDFVFQDPVTGEELLRIRHASRKRLRPGKTFLHQKTVRRSPLTRRGDGARMSVELTEVVYADGSVWRP